jgi:hypothetical protein
MQLVVTGLAAVVGVWEGSTEAERDIDKSVDDNVSVGSSSEETELVINVDIPEVCVDIVVIVSLRFDKSRTYLA